MNKKDLTMGIIAQSRNKTIIEQAKEIKGTFMWAIEQMKQGKKVTRGYCWVNAYLIWNKFPMVLNTTTNSYSAIELVDCEATDWEVVEEPMKTLWDKVCEYEEDDKLFSVKDVKEALKEYLESLKQLDGSFVYKKAKEIFGEEMLK